MNVLLLYPRFPDTFWSYRHALKFISKKATTPPLGLLTVAAMLPREWTKRLVDLNATKLRKRDLQWADYAFISAMDIQRTSARQLIDQCKEAGIRVVGGGPLFSNGPEGFSDVDHLVLNEAELTLPRFLADLEKGCAGRLYRSDEFADMHQTPIPLWDLIDRKRYASMAIQSSRGCPFQCEFCNVTALFGHRPRYKSARQIIAELDKVYAIGWRRSVFFVDDNFIGNKSYLKAELLPALIEWRKGKSPLSFYTETSINLADDGELLDMMAQAGFDMVFIGIETPDEKSLAECGKKQNEKRNLLEDVKRIQRAGIQVQGGFILGFDSDTPGIFQRQIDFIQNSGIVTAMVGLLQAIPGTKLFERLKREDRLRGQSTGDNVDGTTNIVTNMSFETLREGYRSIMRHIYSPENYYRRVKTFLSEYKPPKICGSIRYHDVLAFFRAMYRLGILGKERFHYWKLLAWTSLRRPRLIATAVSLAIMGYHFRKICERHKFSETAGAPD